MLGFGLGFLLVPFDFLLDGELRVIGGRRVRVGLTSLDIPSGRPLACGCGPSGQWELDSWQVAILSRRAISNHDAKSIDTGLFFCF
jgi:hypothetical protein